MKKVTTRTKECGNRRYLIKYCGKEYPSLSYFAKSHNIPVGTITKLISRKYMNSNVIVTTINGYHIEIIAYD